MSSAYTSGVTPESTTAKLAGEVPKESSKEPSNEATGPRTASSSDLPGTFPQTPANENSTFSVNPIPATSGHGNPIHLQPGEKVPDPSTLTSNTVSSTAKDDPSLAKSDDSANEFGVAPLPATGGFGNPINLEPGEKVPHSSQFTSNTIDTHVTTDKESYEKGSNAPILPDVVTPQKERDSKGASMFSVPGISKNMIPESSLPMGESVAAEKDPGAFIQSAGQNSTTAALAGAVPKEGKTTAGEKDPGAFIQSAGGNSTTAALAGAVPKEPSGLPQIVQESQAEAGTDAEAGHNRQAVAEKSDMEKELESKVPESAVTSEGIAGGNASTSAIGGASHGSHALPASVQQSINEMNKGSAIAPNVPDAVQESITESHVAPEAAGDRKMVGEKSAMESELLDKVPTENAAGEPAPVTSAALTGSAPAPTDNETTESAAMSNPNPAAAASTDNSSVAAPSNDVSKTGPPSTEKSAVLGSSSTDSTTSTSTMKGAKSFPAKSSGPPPAISEPATTSDPPMTTAAAPAATPATEKVVQKSSDYSREVSPMTKTDHQSTPMVTTGLGSSTAPQTSQATPSKAAASPTSATSASTDKKSKRASGFFGKLKAKFSDKDKK
ncbi:Cruciform DNA binding protein [Xanthoria parietina]